MTEQEIAAQRANVVSNAPPKRDRSWSGRMLRLKGYRPAERRQGEERPAWPRFAPRTQSEGYRSREEGCGPSRLCPSLVRVRMTSVFSIHLLWFPQVGFRDLREWTLRIIKVTDPDFYPGIPGCLLLFPVARAVRAGEQRQPRPEILALARQFGKRGVK